MFKFDTRNKKPKVYNILILSVAVAAVVAVLLLSGLKIHAAVFSAIAAAYFLAVIIMLVTAFLRQLQYNPYSYNTIYYMGFALFLFFLFVTQIMITVRMINQPVMNDVHQILYMLLNSARNYMLITFPFILIFSVALCISNISLIRHEGKRLVNVLGIILSFLLVGGAALIYVYDFYATGSQTQVMCHDLITNLLSAIYIYFESMLIGAIIADLIAANHKPDFDKDFMVILGCGIQKDGRPTPLLRGRIDLALEFARKQKEQTGKELIFVTSGGQGPSEVVSESASMKQYLLEQGVSEDKIIEEDKSSSTFENMKFSKEMIWAVDQEGKIAFSTTNYHVFRGGLYARRVKMRAVGIGARTKWYFWPNASVREFVGLLSEHRGKQALIFIGMIVIYIVLTLIVYLN